MTDKHMNESDFDSKFGKPESAEHRLLMELGITEKLFKHILFSFMSSITLKKKLYIALPVEWNDYPITVQKLFELFYAYIPYAYRRELGALPVYNEPEGIKYGHVMFAKPGTLHYGDHTLEKQYIFDLANGWISGVELEGQHEYLNFAWDSLVAGENLNTFFEFAERVLSGLPEEQQVELSSYYQLTVIYLSGTNYEGNKLGLLFSLLKFLKVNHQEKTDLEHLFIQLLQKEVLAADSDTAKDYLWVVLEFNQFTENDTGLAFILNTLVHHKDQPLFHELWKIIEMDQRTFYPLFDFINKQPDYENLAEIYLAQKYSNLHRVEEILYELKKWLVTDPYLLDYDRFQSRMIEKAANAVGDATEPFFAAKVVKNFNFENEKFKERLMILTEMALLHAIDLDKISIEEILSYGQLTTGKLTEQLVNDEGMIHKLKVMTVLTELFIPQASDINFILEPLSESSRAEVKKMIKRVLQNQLSLAYFPPLLAVFGDDEYPELFDYLSKHGDTEVILSFIKWMVKTTYRPDPNYTTALKNYLKSNPNSIWKDKKARKELRNIQSFGFKKLFIEVEKATSSLGAKFLKRYGARLSILLLVIAIGIGGFFLFDIVFNKEQTEAVSNTSLSSSKPAVAKASETKKKEISLEPFKKWTAEEPFLLNINGDPLKMTFGPTNPIGGQSLILTDAGNVETPLGLVTDLGSTPFDESGILREGFSLYHAEYDFDTNGVPEVVIMALNQASESFVWVYEYQSNPEEGAAKLAAKLAVIGMSNAKLEENHLILLGTKGLSETYTYQNQEFIKQ
ncbi:GAP1-M domain-containing protein [Neobacillus sp. K501]